MLADISQKRSYTIRRKKDRRLRYSLRAAIPAAVVEMVCDTIMIPGGARPVKCFACRQGGGTVARGGKAWYDKQTAQRR